MKSNREVLIGIDGQIEKKWNQWFLAMHYSIHLNNRKINKRPIKFSSTEIKNPSLVLATRCVDTSSFITFWYEKLINLQCPKNIYFTFLKFLVLTASFYCTQIHLHWRIEYDPPTDLYLSFFRFSFYIDSKMICFWLLYLFQPKLQ